MKSEINHALYESAILAIVLDRYFPPQRLRPCRSQHERVWEGTAHCRDGSINLCGRRVYQPGMGLCYCADFISTRVKIDCSEHGMD